ncbi:uncharacterized protein LOC144024062 isoform X2 [Festucalex cinctus]
MSCRCAFGGQDADRHDDCRRCPADGRASPPWTASPESDIAPLLPPASRGGMTTRRPEKTAQGQMATWAESPAPDELECKICYNRYDTRGRKPKVLACLHRVCAKCLKRMMDVGVADGGRPPHPGSPVVWRAGSARTRTRRKRRSHPARRGCAQPQLADRCGARRAAIFFRLPGDHHHGAAGRVAVFRLAADPQRGGGGAVPAPRLAGLRPSRPQVRLLDVATFAPLPAGGAVPGVLELASGGHLPADDGSPVAGRASGQPGPVHAASAGPLRILPLLVPPAAGGACRPLP